MNDKQKALDKLIDFKNQDKFSINAWEKRGLNPSDSETCAILQNLFNECTDSLIVAINSDSSTRELKEILKLWLANVNRSYYDTEEREFICDYFEYLSQIVQIDFKESLNIWLHGRVLNTLFKVTSFLRGQDKILETLTQDCTKCGTKLETFIMRKEIGIPDHSWFIIQCSNCEEYNLLSTRQDIKDYRFGDFTLIEQLPKSDFTEEQANTRLEQLKFFRKK